MSINKLAGFMVEHYQKNAVEGKRAEAMVSAFKAVAAAVEAEGDMLSGAAAFCVVGDFMERLYGYAPMQFIREFVMVKAMIASGDYFINPTNGLVYRVDHDGVFGA